MGFFFKMLVGWMLVKKNIIICINLIRTGFRWLFCRKIHFVSVFVLMCGALQSRCLGLLRSDYLLDVCNSTSVKQVEMNTIASSFGGLTSSAPTHRYITITSSCSCKKYRWVYIDLKRAHNNIIFCILPAICIICFYTF